MEKIVRWVFERKKLSLSLFIFSLSVSVIIALAFVSYLAYLLFFIHDYREVLRLILATGVPFFLVGGLRALISRPRPFSVYPFFCGRASVTLFGHGEKASGSFPSRHAYSAFVIGTVAFFVNPWCALIFGVPAILMCACRVLIGFHFVRDVTAGALVGVLGGVLGEFLLRF